MLNKVRSLLLGLSLIVIIGLLAFYMYVQAGGGSILSNKDGSFQQITFETLYHPAGTPGYLLCPSELCQNASPDGPAQPFAVSAEKLRTRLLDYTDKMPMISARHIDIRKNQFDFLERMPGQHLPAVVAVRILADTNYTSQLVIYSTQPIGDSTDQEHSERVERWISQLANP